MYISDPESAKTLSCFTAAENAKVAVNDDGVNLAGDVQREQLTEARHGLRAGVICSLKPPVGWQLHQSMEHPRSVPPRLITTSS